MRKQTNTVINATPKARRTPRRGKANTTAARAFTAKTVTGSMTLGYHRDALTRGLYLKVQTADNYLKVKAGRSWVFRYSMFGKLREMGLGTPLELSLSEARDKAAELRKLVAAGADPLQARRAQRTAASRVAKWEDCIDMYIDSHRDDWASNVEAKLRVCKITGKEMGPQEMQWRNSLRSYGPKGSVLVHEIDTPMVLACLEPIWKEKTETATRVRGRIETIIDWAVTRGYRPDGKNPAVWHGHLEHALGKPEALKKKGGSKSHDMCEWRDMPAFMAELRTKKGVAARGLEFLIYSAARTGEILGCEWNQIMADKVWERPASIMKPGMPHDVPLVAEQLAILSELSKAHKPFPFSTAAMHVLLTKRMEKEFTVHGFRASFSSWANSRFPALHKVVEMQLSHIESNKVRAVYQRDDLMDARRELMEKWAAFLNGA